MDRLEEKLIPLHEKQSQLEPDRAVTLQEGHLTFMALQQSKLDALTLHISKLAVP